MTTAKPKRLKFSEEEKFLILEEFSLRKDILIPKSGRYRNTMDRQRAWEEITAAVNSLSPLVQRTPDEIRKKWHNMVIDARKELTTVKHPLLRQRPQERLFHNIFALFNKTRPGLAEPLLLGPGFRTKPSSSPAGTAVPLCAAGGMRESSSDLFLRSQNDGLQLSQGNKLLCKTQVLLDADKEMAPGTGCPGKSFVHVPGDPQPSDLCLGGSQESVEKKLLGPSKDPPLTCTPVAETHPVPVPRTTSPLSHGPEVLAPGRTPVPLNCSPDFALAYKIKCPLSPVFEWPCLGVISSPVTHSSRTDSPSSEGIHTAMDDNGETAMPASQAMQCPTTPLPSQQNSVFELVRKRKRLSLQAAAWQTGPIQPPVTPAYSCRCSMQFSRATLDTFQGHQEQNSAYSEQEPSSASVTEDSLPSQRGCVEPAKELWEKHSRLHTEILELQKETLQLQKEKIVLEKEKLLLEIVKLRRELDT